MFDFTDVALCFDELLMPKNNDDILSSVYHAHVIVSLFERCLVPMAMRYRPAAYSAY